MYVGNLPYLWGKTDLRDAFSKFGRILRVNLLHRNTPMYVVAVPRNIHVFRRNHRSKCTSRGRVWSSYMQHGNGAATRRAVICAAQWLCNGNTMEHDTAWQHIMEAPRTSTAIVCCHGVAVVRSWSRLFLPQFLPKCCHCGRCIVLYVPSIVQQLGCQCAKSCYRCAVNGAQCFAVSLLSILRHRVEAMLQLCKKIAPGCTRTPPDIC